LLEVVEIIERRAAAGGEGKLERLRFPISRDVDFLVAGLDVTVEKL